MASSQNHLYAKDRARAQLAHEKTASHLARSTCVLSPLLLAPTLYTLQPVIVMCTYDTHTS